NDTIVVDIKKDSIDCVELEDKDTYDLRMQQWKQAVKENHGIHPHAAHVTNRLLKRMRATAKPALDGGGMN
ncbi:MAG TPA: hypothetical protein VLF89_06785, partial [Candidatus Saccharimonadales bacterium]|nr:hypothetical protein [Candidatus Saccharimonadales bacterium]